MIKQKGQSLIEIILYVAVFTIFFTMLTTTYIGVFNIYKKNEAINIVTTNGNFLINLISKKINNATSVTAPLNSASGSSLNLITSVSQTNPTELYIDSGNLYLKEGLNSAVKLNATNISVDSLEFTSISNSGSQSPSVKYTITLSANIGSLFSEEKYTTTYYGTANIR